MSAGKENVIQKAKYCVSCQKFSLEDECDKHELIQDEDLRFQLMEFQEKIKMNNFFLFMEQFYLGYEKLTYFNEKYKELIKLNFYL
jgi:radical SAM superfamily enzyme